MELKILPLDFGILEPYCSRESIDYLKKSLKQLEVGSPPTPSFPLYGKRDVSIVDTWLNKIRGRTDVPSFVLEYEDKRKEKFAPQGGIPKWSEVREDFMCYQTALQPVEYVDDEILAIMIKEYATLHARLYSAPDALKHLKATNKIETRAAGWSEFQLKKTDEKAQTIALRMCKSHDYIHGAGYVFTRLHKKKLRIFMPMPYSLMIEQARWFISFLGEIQRSLKDYSTKSSFLAWSEKCGFQICFDYMNLELSSAHIQEDEYIAYYSLDFKMMDTCTGTEQYQHFVVPIFEAAHHTSQNNELAQAMLLTTTAPIYCPEGIMSGDHGTASGAEVTNCGETICNDYVQRRLIRVLETLLPPKSFRCVSRRANGDDSILIFFVKKSLAFDKFKESLLDAVSQTCKETGFNVQLEKQEVSNTHGFFCQHILWYDTSTQKLNWMYPSTLILNSIINPDKEYKKADWDKDYRDIDIVEKLDNGSNLPYFHDLIDFVNDGMKYRLLGRTEEETRRILSKYDRYRELQTLGERYNRQDYHISNSPTVAYVLSKR